MLFGSQSRLPPPNRITLRVGIKQHSTCRPFLGRQTSFAFRVAKRGLCISSPLCPRGGAQLVGDDADLTVLGQLVLEVLGRTRHEHHILHHHRKRSRAPILVYSLTLKRPHTSHPSLGCMALRGKMGVGFVCVPWG